MTRRVSMRHKRKEAPEWVFPWRGTRQSPLPKLAALFIALGLFATMFAFVRIRVAGPTPWAPRQATVFRALDDAEGRALALSARAGGPFPSRFQPSEIDWLRGVEDQALATAAWQPPPYVPQLRGLPAIEPPAPRLGTPGKPVLPKRPAPDPVPVAGKLRQVPALQPLAGVTDAGMPGHLPEFTGEVPPAPLSGPWRFLMRLDSQGRVRDVVPLTGGGDDAGMQVLVEWLRRLGFPPDGGADGRWIAVGLSFINRPEDGTDAH